MVADAVADAFDAFHSILFFPSTLLFDGHIAKQTVLDTLDHDVTPWLILPLDLQIPTKGHVF